MKNYIWRYVFLGLILNINYLSLQGGYFDWLYKKDFTNIEVCLITLVTVGTATTLIGLKNAQLKKINQEELEDQKQTLIKSQEELEDQQQTLIKLLEKNFQLTNDKTKLLEQNLYLVDAIRFSTELFEQEQEKNNELKQTNNECFQTIKLLANSLVEKNQENNKLKSLIAYLGTAVPEGVTFHSNKVISAWDFNMKNEIYVNSNKSEWNQKTTCKLVRLNDDQSNIPNQIKITAIRSLDNKKLVLTDKPYNTD